ncbi:hypothetical protein [Chryseobacterium pennipullorum]|uniref:DUF3347 domain-containing protein n=1 Tax=Chryseobacterium pennipullorum TaxID=2258963 RepID=A0A3D9AK97_9FLAO|nr:hypothetical protein [Chryseobacterium pennipullorum]REC41739.1 hypothetical protein DRF67_21095 [Chryseobacterium pennipullorum]
MKKAFLLLSIPLVAMISCTNESIATNTTTTPVSKQEAVQKFNKAMKEVVIEKEPANAKRTSSMELSDYKKNKLLPAAKELISSTGISMKEIEKQTGGDKEKVLTWAVQVYGEYNKQINQNYQSEN